MFSVGVSSVRPSEQIHTEKFKYWFGFGWMFVSEIRFFSLAPLSRTVGRKRTLNIKTETPPSIGHVCVAGADENTRKIGLPAQGHSAQQFSIRFDFRSKSWFSCRFCFCAKLYLNAPLWGTGGGWRTFQIKRVLFALISYCRSVPVIPKSNTWLTCSHELFYVVHQSQWRVY